VHWTIDNGGKIIGSNNNLNVQIDLTDVVGIANVCVRVENNCGLSPFECKPINKIKTPKIEVENSIVLCEGDLHQLCIKKGFDIGHTYSFIATGGTLINNTPASSCPFEMKFDEPGKFIVGVKSQNKNCISNEVIQNIEVIKKQSNPVVSFTSFAKKIDISWTKLDCVKEYRYYVDNAFVGTTKDNFISLSDLQPGYELNFRVEALSEGCACGIGVGSNIVKTLLCNELQVNLTSSKKIFCESEWSKSVSLSTIIVGSNGKGSLKWEGKGVDNNGIFTPAEAGAGSNLVKIIYEEDGCIYQDSILMNMIVNPNVELQTTDPICEEDDMGSLDIISNITEQLQFLLDGKAMDAPFVDNISIGNHTIQVIDGNNCSILKSFEINEPTFPQISIVHSDRSYYDNENIPLAINTTSGNELELIDSVHWFINGELVCRGKCMELNLSNIAAGIYQHEIVVFYKTCLKSETFEVLVKGSPKIFLPNIISLTSANQNKFFNIVSNDTELKVMSCKIYSRWGNIVFQKLDFIPMNETSLWDGTFNGEALNPDVYVLEVNYLDQKGVPIKIIKDLTIIK
jgi:hypothetical protein